MENNNKTKLTHKQKMDLVTKGLYFLTTQEVDALIKTIEAFKAREDSGKPRLDDLRPGRGVPETKTCGSVGETGPARILVVID